MNFAFDPQTQLIDRLQSFYKQSERIVSVTHKPRKYEFQQIAYVTAIGIVLVGLIGFVISMTAHFLRQF